jgi:hypothetical protein
MTDGELIHLAHHEGKAITPFSIVELKDLIITQMKNGK